MNDSKTKINFLGGIIKSFHYTKKYRFLSVCVIVTALATSVFEGVGMTTLIPVIQSFFLPVSGASLLFADIPGIGKFLGTFVTQHSSSTLLFFVFGVICIKNAFVYASSFFISKITNRLRWDLQSNFFSSLIDADVQFFDQQKSGDLVGQVSLFSERISLFLFSGFTFLTSTLHILIYLGILFFLMPSFTGFALLILLVLLPIIRLFLRKIYNISLRNVTLNKQMFGTLSELFQNVRLIKVFRKESFHKVQFESLTQQLFRNFMSISNCSNIFKPGSEIIIVFIFVISLFIGSQMSVLQSVVAPSLLFVYLYFFFQFFGQINGINHLRSKMYENLPSLWEYEKMLALTKDHIRVRGTVELSGAIQNITFENISFSYSASTPILKNLNFSIQRGSFVAFVGLTGSGKSTIANLVSSLYMPSSGKILVDGVDLQDIDKDSWLKKVRYVPQEAQLFSDTLLSNISYGSPDASFHEVREAAKLAQIDDFIMSLPEQYNTVIGERGSTLSGGQKQRVALARALLCNPEVFILDEATSALDAKTEDALQNSLIGFKGDRTFIVIAHRLSTIKNADKIFVLGNGEVREFGTHEELLSKKGLYQEMYALQSLTQ